jgi:hypothetical protein
MPPALEVKTEILARYDKGGLDGGAWLHATPVLHSKLEILVLVFRQLHNSPKVLGQLPLYPEGVPQWASTRWK